MCSSNLSCSFIHLGSPNGTKIVNRRRDLKPFVIPPALPCRGSAAGGSAVGTPYSRLTANISGSVVGIVCAGSDRKKKLGLHCHLARAERNSLSEETAHHVHSDSAHRIPRCDK